MDNGTPPEQSDRRIRRERNADQLRWIAQARSLAATLDLLPQPIVLLLPGEPIRVWHANAAARHWFSSQPDLRLRDGALTAGPLVAPELAEAVAHARALGAGNASHANLSTRPEATAATLHVLEFGASADLPVNDVLMFAVQPSASVERGLHRLCREFQLTRKEAETALGLYSMGSVHELARCNGKSVHTVRTQLKAAMQKTGTHTQAGLVALIANRLAG
jgi:DNA-binding CsgD family transcriptional regulator